MRNGLVIILLFFSCFFKAQNFGNLSSDSLIRRAKTLNNYLLSVSKTPTEEQHAKLDHLFDDWKGNLEQVDDVCIIGIKF